MVGKSWLIALVLVAANTAQAEGAPAQGAPAQRAPAQDALAQGAPAQAPTAPTQAVPAVALVPEPDLPPPGGAPRNIPVPAYPGYPPVVFASAAQAADYNSWRLERLTARQRGLTLAGRPADYQAQRVGGFALLATGSVMALSCFLIAIEDGAPLDDRTVIGLVSAGLFGVGMALGGVLWLSYLKRDNPYRQEIAALHRERGHVKGELKRARKQAQAEQRMSFDFERLQVRF